MAYGSAFVVPNEANAPANIAQARPDEQDFVQLVRAFEGTGVMSGCDVTAQATPNMTVAVAAGRIAYQGVAKAVTAGNVTIEAADATNPRFDLVMTDNAGALVNPTAGNGKGTAAANPVHPAVPTNRVVLAIVFVPAAATTIVEADIVDRRTFLRGGPNPTVHVYRTSVQSIPSGTIAVPISWSATRYDTDAIWAAGTPDTLTVKTAGVYAIQFHGVWAIAGGRRLLNIELNGVDIARFEPGAAAGAAPHAPTHQVRTEWKLAVNDILKATVHQDSGAALNFGGDATSIGYRNGFLMTKIADA